MNKKYDKVFINGKIYTGDSDLLYVDTFAVKNGRISWIGQEKDINIENETIIDLKGKRVLPGLVDSHMHPFMLAEFSKQISVLPPLIYSIDELVETICKVRQEQGPEEWICGWGYDEGKLKERRAPNRYDLDKGASDVPISIVRTCGHIRCVNSKALEMMGIDKNTPDPEGGKIDRDENGEPTGVLRENARNLALSIMPEISSEINVQNLVDINELLLSQGITTIGDLAEFTLCYPDYAKAHEKGFLPRVAYYQLWDLIKDDADFNFTPEDTNPQNHIHIAGVKLIGDGSVSGRTAWCDKSYIGSTEDYGMPVCTCEDIQNAMEFSKRNKCQLSIHAMGANAIDRAIDLTYKEEPWTTGKTPYVRIEHAAMPTKQAIERAAQSGIAFVTQPNFLYAEIESYLENLGHEWTKETYPINDMLNAGVNISFSTDAPATAWATPSDPFICLKGAVTRVAYNGTDCGEKHRVDIKTAIDLYTNKSALMLGFESIGKISPGYLADFIILDRDIFEIAAEEIDQVKVEETYMNGVSVYQRYDK